MRCGDLKESYLEDEKIFQSFFVKICIAILLILLTIMPFVAGPYILYIMNLIGFAIIGAVGLNLLTGFTGQISLGHAAFIGVEGYTTAILVTRLGLPFLCAVADPGRAAPIPQAPGSLAETGRGLHIICALSDRWGYTTPNDTGKVVWATFTSRLTPPLPAR